jgi:hypothetical protein
MQPNNYAVVVLALVLGIAVPPTGHAAVTGELDIAGVLTLGSTDAVKFSAPAADSGPFFVGAGTGTFATLASTVGTIKDADITPGPFSVPAFITLAGAPGIAFELASIVPGIFSLVQCGAPPLVSQQCSPAIPGFGLSALNFVNTTHGSILSFEVDGNFIDTASGQSTPYAGTFTAQFAQRYQGVLAAIGNGQTLTTT